MRSDEFFDTNILVYLFAEEAEKADTSNSLLLQGGVVSVQVLNEFVSVIRRKHRAPWSVVDDALAKFKAKLDVTPLTLETHELGVAIAKRHNFAIYDAMIVAAARLAGCRTLYTEDLHDGQVVGDLRIVNPYV